MAIPLIHPENQPDAYWPFKQSQLVRENETGYFYNVICCTCLLGQWWVEVENLAEDDAPYWYEAEQLRKASGVDHAAARKMFEIVGGNDYFFV